MWLLLFHLLETPKSVKPWEIEFSLKMISQEVSQASDHV